MMTKLAPLVVQRIDRRAALGLGFIGAPANNGVTVSGVPTRRFVDLLEVAETGSGALSINYVRRQYARHDGSYAFHLLDTSKVYDVIGREDRTNIQFRDVFVGSVQPVAYTVES